MNMRLIAAVFGLIAIPPRFVQAAAPGLARLEAMTARFAPTPIEADAAGLSAGDRKAVSLLIEASKIVDSLFLRQIREDNSSILRKLDRDFSPLGKARRRYFWINKGPWSTLDDHAAFLPGVPARKPLGAAFYPETMAKAEFETWISGLSAAEQTQAKGFFSVIRKSKGSLEIVPYSRAYAAELRRLAILLREAAGATDNASLKRFLALRADAFLSDDYYASDVAWMELDAPIEPTIGPYETYQDELFGYKAAFESYVTLRDDAETSRLKAFSSHLQTIEDHLPIPREYRNPKIAAAAPIRVVNVVFSAGDGNRGVQTAAFNLPNDERVLAEKGAKRVMLKNVQEAKFRSVLTPIAARVLAPESRGDLDFGAFFGHILAHELCHGLGPHQIQVAGRSTTPRAELKDIYGAIEEAKADALGLFALQYLMSENGRLQIPGLESGPAAERKLYATFLASSFRTLRFGIHEAHGRHGVSAELSAGQRGVHRENRRHLRDRL